MWSLGALHERWTVGAVAVAMAAVAVAASLPEAAAASAANSSEQGTAVAAIASSLRIAGSSTVFPVAKAWQALVPDVYNYIIDAGGSSSGATRLCSPYDDPSHVDIATMSRDWRTTEAERLDDGSTLECLDSVSGSRTGRRLTQLQVGTDAVAVVVKKNGAAHRCLTNPAVGGLTVAQLRWIFTDWTDSELEAAPYGNQDLSSVIPGDDGDSIKEWSDISSACEEVPITPYGTGEQSGTYDLFTKAVFNRDIDEGFAFCNMTEVHNLELLSPAASADLIRTQRDSLGTFNCYVPSENKNVKEWILADRGGIAFLSYASFVRSQKKLIASRIATDHVKGIADTDEYIVTPSIYSIRDGSYGIFTRQLYMVVDNQAWSLCRDYLASGFSDEGQDAVAELGFVPVNAAVRAKMRTQIQVGENLQADYVPVPPSECANGTELRSLTYINPFGRLKENYTCMPCEQGFFKWANTATLCEACAPGTVAPELGRSSCDVCGPGQYADRAGRSECMACSNGTYVSYPGATECDRCLPGHVQAQTGASECVPCPAGMYQPEVGRFECMDCEPGHYAQAEASTACVACDPGYFHSQVAADKPCSRCPRGNYTDEIGASECRGCLSGLTTQYPGSYSVEQCVCGPGTYMPSSASSIIASPCLSCPPGMLCLIGSNERYLPMRESHSSGTCPPDMSCNYPSVVPGYMSMAADPLKVYKCLSEEHCPGGAPATCGKYRDATEVACGTCQEEPKAFENVNECELCSGPDILRLVIAILLFIAALSAAAFAFNKDLVRRSAATTRIAVVLGLTASCMQCLAVLSALKLDWFEPIKGLLQFFSVFAFDPSLFRVSCSVSAGPVTSYLVRELVAPVSVVVVFIALLIKKRFVDRHVAVMVELLNTVGAVFSILFISVVISAMSPLLCYNHPGDNGQSMVAYPSVLCYDDKEWFGLFAVGSLSLCFVVIPFLAVCGYGTWCYTSWILSNKLTWLTAYRFLFVRFRGERHYYGAIYLARSFLIPCVPAVARGHIALQVVLLSVVWLSFLIVQMSLQPWLGRMINLYDSTLSAWLIVVLVCGVASSDFTTERKNIETLLVCLVVSTVLIIALIVVKGLWDHFRRAAQFHDLICYHKDGAGAQARFLKILLCKMGKRRVFIDSDNLQQLDGLFEVVRTHVSRLIVYLSGETLACPWCCGEIVTAHANNVRTVVVRSSDFEIPAEKTREQWSTLLDFDNSSLLQYGISIDAVIDASGWLLSGVPATIAVNPRRCGRARLEQVACELLNKGQVSMRRPSAVDDAKDAVLVCSDPEDDEASATAGILGHKLGERVMEKHLVNGVVVLADLETTELEDGKEELLVRLVREARACIVVLTPYSLHSIIQLQVIVEAIVSKATPLVPVSTPLYEFPGESYYTSALPFVARRVMPQDIGLVVESMRLFFKIIAAPLGTHASDKVIQTQAIEIFDRIPAAVAGSSQPTLRSTSHEDLQVYCSGREAKPQRRWTRDPGADGGGLRAVGRSSTATIPSIASSSLSTRFASQASGEATQEVTIMEKENNNEGNLPPPEESVFRMLAEDPDGEETNWFWGLAC